MRRLVPFAFFIVMPITSGCSGTDYGSIDAHALEYVALSLNLNTHDDGYVDAYYGDPALRDSIEASPAALDEIRQRAEGLLAALEKLDQDNEATFSRNRYLQRHVSSLLARMDLLEGAKLSFDEEARAIYDSQPPSIPESHFDSLLAAIDAAVPGSGPLTDRVEAFRDQFVIPGDRLDAVFMKAMEECRRRTAEYIDMPADEEFTIEYVTDKPWSGYNWFKGDSKSLIQVNTDSPTRIDGAIHLACHEGYPGHHVFNLLRESRYRDEGLVEFSLQPLYAPIAPIAEGSANYGKVVAFPGDERRQYEKEVLFPLAGLDTARADEYYQLLDLMSSLAFARNEAARNYLNGDWDADKTAQWLSRYQLMSDDRARRTVRFIDTYRAYVINYNYGEELVARYIEENAATGDEAWRLFEELLAATVVPSDLY